MKKTFTPSLSAAKHLRISGPASVFALAAILALSLLTATNSAAQSNVTASVMEMVPASDMGSGPVWKSSVDYAAVLTAERANATQTLATPNLKIAQTALYNGYDRLLGYMQVDLANNVLIEDIASINFKRVLQEAPADPVLQNMLTNEFSVLYQTLVEKLMH